MAFLLSSASPALEGIFFMRHYLRKKERRMYTNKTGGFWNRFIVAFILLFFILIVLPMILEWTFYLFSEGTAPRYNSIIVFENIVEEYAAVGKFVEILKKIINFM